MSAKTTFIVVAALMAQGIAATAQAAPSDDVVSVKVATGGLNLSSEDGARVALNRVREAAERICGGQPDLKLLRAVATYRACVKSTVDIAVASTNAPALQTLNGTQMRNPTFIAAKR